jgi:hypothetical protein
LRFSVSGGAAVVDWSYDLPYPYPYGYSEVFGDADLLPSGNVLTNWWPAQLSPDAGVEADAYFQEITPEKDVAWEMAFYNTDATLPGRGCRYDATDPACVRDIFIGWKAYSVERFYDAPPVYDFERVDDGYAFSAHAAIKLQHASPAAWRALNAAGADLAAGAFDLPAHHLQARVAFAAPPDAAALVVRDAWGQESRVDLAAAAEDAPPR